MAERRGPPRGAPEDHGASLTRGPRGKQQSCHEDGKDTQTITSERTKALLEYRALCTSARFWIQSELLDLRVGGYFSSNDSSRNAYVQPSSALGAPAAGAPVPPKESAKDSPPGLVGDLPTLMKRHLTCPLLARLLSHDPVLSGKLATLDRVLWHRRSKHEPQTAGWMSHDTFCPEGCLVGVPHGAASEAVGKAGAPVRSVGVNGSSRTSTMDSMLGTEGGPEAPGVGGLSAASEGLSPSYSESAEDESRPVTAWVTCRQCMEHFAYIVASLLVFLKPSELRDLAIERQQAQCCGFVFCGRRNVTTPEKRRAALWRWTLDFAGSKAVSEDELVQFCCSRCCNRQQQLLRLLDEEPMYARPGIKEWITDALQRKASHKPHPHGLTEADIILEEKPRETLTSLEGASAGSRCSRRRSPPPPENRRGPPVALEMLLDEASGTFEASGLVRRVLRESHFAAAAAESPSAERSKTASAHSLPDGRRVPVSVDAGDESSADEAAPRNVQKQGGAASVCIADERNEPYSHREPLSGGRHTKEAAGSGSILMLDYSCSEKPPEALSADRVVLTEDSLLLRKIPSSSTEASTASSSSLSGTLLPPERAGGEVGARAEALLAEHREEAKQAEPPIKGRGSRVRFADDDAEESEGDGEGDSPVASVFKHFFNMKDEDDEGPFFYSRQTSLATHTHTAANPSRSGTGELRSILKPATEPLEPAPSESSSAEAQVGYMRLSDLVIAFDLLSSCCTDASSQFLAAYHRRFCTCACEGAMKPAAPSTSSQQSEGEDSPKGKAESSSSRRARRKDSEAEESDSVSCMDGESGDEIDPAELWRRRQQQLLKAVLRSLPPSAENFAPLITELCETFQPLQPLPTLRCSLCSCIAAVLLLLLLLLRARPLTCCCCCEGCRPWSNNHARHSRCSRRQSPSAACGRAEGSEVCLAAAASFYFDDALTIAKEEDVGLALIDFVRSTISQSAPVPSPLRPLSGGVETSNASVAEAAETTLAHHHEERAIHVLLESIFSRITRPIMQLSQTAHFSPVPSQ